jgi:hypothetical protein
MTTTWKKSDIDWEENFDRCDFCNRLEEKAFMKDGLCSTCFVEIYELPETVRIDTDLDDLYGLSFLD